MCQFAFVDSTAYLSLCLWGLGILSCAVWSATEPSQCLSKTFNFQHINIHFGQNTLCVRRSCSHHKKNQIDPTTKSGGCNHSYKLISIDTKSHPNVLTPKTIPYGRRGDYISRRCCCCTTIWAIILRNEPPKHTLWPACEHDATGVRALNNNAIRPFHPNHKITHKFT